MNPRAKMPGKRASQRVKLNSSHFLQVEPQTAPLHGQMLDAWKQVPARMHPAQPCREGI